MNLSLQTLDARSAALSRRLGFGRRMRLSDLDQPVFALTITATDGEACRGDVTDIVVDPGPIRFFDAHGLLCLLGSVAPPADPARLPLAVHLALSRWPRALIDAIGMPTQSLAHELASGIDLQLALQREDVCTRAIARAPAAVWERLLEAMTPISRAGVESLPLAWPMVVGRTQLPLSQVRGLDIGDVVRLRESLIDASGNGILTLGGLMVQVRLLGIPGARVLQVMCISKGIPPMPNSTTSAATAAAVAVGSSVDTLAITLVAELGTVRSSVGELQTLAAGCVLEVGERNPGEVTLRVQDGQAFAHGEMVDVGGRIGVRITRLAALP